MKSNEKSIPVLLVSMYEIIRTGILAVLLKMEPGVISEIKEAQNIAEAKEEIALLHYPLVIIDESLLDEKHMAETKTWIGDTRRSIILCQIFRNDEASIERVKQAGASGYFYRGIALEDFKTELKKLIEGELVNGAGIHLF